MNNKMEREFEEMADFFDSRAAAYDAHMAENVDHFGEFYRSVAGLFPATDDKVKILDLGCGTGLELRFILKRCPNAAVTGIDLSGKMLSKLRCKSFVKHSRVELISGSYLSLPFKGRFFDYVVTVMTLHHLLPADKLSLYRNIRLLLMRGGRYIEGDYIVSSEKETRLMGEYKESGDDDTFLDGSYHIDIPMSVPTQQKLLFEAGFRSVEVAWQRGEAAVLQAGTVA